MGRGVLHGWVGYAVELALKACIIKTLMATDAFPDKKFSADCYTHVIEKLGMVQKSAFQGNTLGAGEGGARGHHFARSPLSARCYDYVLDNAQVLPWLEPCRRPASRVGRLTPG